MLEVVILAAGKGTRMRSSLPKVLHPLAGRPLLGHVLERARALDPANIHVVCGHGGEAVRAAFPDADLTWVSQPEQLGTGHALARALPGVGGDAQVLVLYGDVPLVGIDTLRALAAAGAGAVGLLTARLAQPAGYGRIVRNGTGEVVRIVEEQDASDAERAIDEINTGFMAAPAELFRDCLGRLGNKNAQGEYYLTDVIGLAAVQGIKIATRQPEHAWEILGVNSRRELAELEKVQRKQTAEQLMAEGVSLRDPARFDLRGKLVAGRDVEIDVNVVLEGTVRLGDGVRIGANNVIRDSEIAAGAIIHENCVIEDARIGEGCYVGPFARIRPGTVLDAGARIGNFVETKKAQIGAGSKINHLSYVGDATVGRNVNIGAGTITCNYDGVHKHHTEIGDDAFIGSNTQLVAPVRVGEGATIGAGSTISRDAPAGKLTLTRARQETLEGWERPKKEQND